MVFKFVYRALRQASDWALGFYSEIQVDGVENVPKYGPVIVVSSHHNEILDIATLAVTIPHRRTLCFWAKSTLFKSPLVRAVLLSSGSIPVRRATKTDTSIANLHQALFFETFRTLDAGEAVGVFPEGTSYTEPQIAQIKDGAAWAALEYMRWRKVNNGDGEENANRQLLIIPVGIVYTGKSQYQSRVCVRWGKPIDIMSYAEKYLEGPENDVRAIIRSLSKEIERRLMQVTVNAPDWDTLHIATVARDILYGSEKNIPLERYVTVSQTLIDLFASSEPSPSLSRAKRSLIRYYSLLYHCDISHGTLSVVLPPSRRWPTRPQAAYIFARQITITFLHPRSFLFFPVFILHIPAYFIGWLAGRVLASPSYEETQAQYKAILGGLGAEAVYLLVGSVVTRALGSMIDAHSLRDSMRSPSNKTELGLQVLCKIGMWFFKIGGVQSVGGRVKRLLGVCGILYGTAWVLSKWHNALVGGNYAQLKRLLTSFKVFIGILSPKSVDIPSEQLDTCFTPPAPRANPFIKRRDHAEVHRAVPLSTDRPSGRENMLQNKRNGSSCRPALASCRLIRHLFVARSEAICALAEFIDHVQKRGNAQARDLGEVVLQYPTALRPN